jgi:hypothetical protein
VRGGEGDPVAVLAGLEGERDREVGLPRARWAEEADVGALVDPGQLRQVQHQRLLRSRLRRPVKVVERLQGGETGVADAHPCTGGVAGEHLGLQERLEKLLVGPLLGAGALRCLLEPLQHPWCFQLCEQVGEPLADLGAALGHAHSSA